eukprot:TRINITY_DN27378_c0_g7_i1.p1 TRINITY_DN27378_c0_g7~~TRINITY_DN27378_c0_g7_i1.p1  ORF type:complete len:627 (-),score=99.65 TRINITY_DN27378_c0_g7_i1:285-2033(-)
MVRRKRELDTGDFQGLRQLEQRGGSRSRSIEAFDEDTSSDEDDARSGSSYTSDSNSLELHLSEAQVGLTITESVYEAALVAPVILEPRAHRLLTWYFLLALNGVLQSLVLIKLHFLSGMVKDSENARLFELCQRPSPPLLHMDWAYAGNSSHTPTMWDCSPFEVTLMVSGRNLDRDGDGRFTRADVREIQAEWEAHPYKWIDFAGTFQHFMSSDFARNAGAPADALENGVDMAWLQKQEPLLQLCAISNKNLCANLEARGILSDRFPNSSTVSLRIAACEDMVDNHCSMIFGERYKLYQVRNDELCGDASVTWMPNKGIRAFVYAMSDKYDNIRDGIIRPQYFVFLTVIDIIWLLMMWREFREIWNWWCVLPFFATTSKQVGGKRRAERRGHGIRINYIPYCHKVCSIIFNLIPRTIIWVALTIIGTKFLVMADSYVELILNSVALGFLIEIDDMLYAAVISEFLKSQIEKVNRIVLPETRQPTQRATLKELASDSVLRGVEGVQRLCHRPHTTVLQAMLIVLVPALSVCYFYMAPYGKLDVAGALDCLCQAASSHCASALRLGGEVHLPNFASRGFLALSM